MNGTNKIECYTRPERLARDKHSSLFAMSFVDGAKYFVQLTICVNDVKLNFFSSSLMPWTKCLDGFGTGKTFQPSPKFASKAWSLKGAPLG